jgi:hypothetical protein
MKKPTIFLLLITVFTLSCQKKPHGLGYISMTETISPGQTSQSWYRIHQIEFPNGGGIYITGFLGNSSGNQTNEHIFITMQDYKIPGTYNLSLSRNCITHEYISQEIFNDSLYGTIQVIEADSLKNDFKAHFNGVYIPDVSDTISYPFLNGYMEIFCSGML